MDYAEGNFAETGAAHKPAEQVEQQQSEAALATRLVMSAGLMLFVELALIRWLGSNVVHLSYFTNFVLLGSFLGIGAGFLIARKNLPPIAMI